VSDFLHRVFVFRPTAGSFELEKRNLYADIGTDLKDIWLTASNLIDLVDVTDFYLLLLEDNLYDERDDSGQLELSEWAGWLGLTEWKAILIIWVVSVSVVMLWVPALVVLHASISCCEGLFGLVKWCNIERPMPDGLDFWRCFIAYLKREEQEGAEHAWSAAESYYSHDLPRRQNNTLFYGAVRSLLAVELPFLLIRVHCSMRYNILASSLLIKNILSCVYDLTIIFQGCLYRKAWRTAHDNVRYGLKGGGRFLPSRDLRIQVRTPHDDDGSDSAGERSLPYDSDAEYLLYKRLAPKGYDGPTSKAVDAAVPTILEKTGFVS